MNIRVLAADEKARYVDRLAEILIDAVDSGASVGFLGPLTPDRARPFWEGVTADPAVVTLVAEIGGEVVGTVSIQLIGKENQPHRVEIFKLAVHRSARRRGVAAALMTAAEAEAARLGRTLGVLDTTTGSDAERLYRRLGWTELGPIPGYALNPDGSMGGTTIFYKTLR